MERRLHRGELIAVLVVLALILTITFWPTPVDRPFDSQLSRVLASLHSRGVPLWFDYSFVQNAANVVMFAPFGALVASLMMRPLWWVSGLLGLTLSLIIEFSQFEFLPARLASPFDLAANTAGALLGGALVALRRALLTRRRPERDFAARETT